MSYRETFPGSSEVLETRPSSVETSRKKPLWAASPLQVISGCTLANANNLKDAEHYRVGDWAEEFGSRYALGWDLIQVHASTRTVTLSSPVGYSRPLPQWQTWGTNTGERKRLNWRNHGEVNVSRVGLLRRAEDKDKDIANAEGDGTR